MNKHTICFVAGKSGGHIIPCLHIAQQYKKQHKAEILFFSTTASLDISILSHSNIVSRHIALPLRSIISKTWWGYTQVVWDVLISCIVSIKTLYTCRPATIITTGGAVAIPVCLAGFIFRIPITLYYLDVEPGRSLKFLRRLATTHYVCFKKTALMIPNAEYIPYPLKYNQQDRIAQRNAQQLLHIPSHVYTIVILGGSQGSVFLNQCIKNYVISHFFHNNRIHIIHQTGSHDATDWNMFYKENNVHAHIFTYQDNLSHFYSVADLIICRGGAGTLFEVKFFKKRCIIIPLVTSTTDHQ